MESSPSGTSDSGQSASLKVNSTAPPKPADNAEFSRIADRVRERIGRPVDKWAVTATLEAMGFRDTDAQSQFGADDLFVLSERLYSHLQSEGSPPSASTSPHRAGWKRTLQTLTSYARGLLFVAPMALQIAAVLFLGYSLWAWLYFTEAQATVVALGTLLSFIVTGGFVQSIGREGHLYQSQNAPHLAYRACRRLIGVGMLTVGGVTLFFLVTNAIFPYYPFSLMAISAVYFVLLSALWLSLSLLYIINHLSAIVGVTLIGIVPVFGVMTYTEWGIHVAHGVGLTLTVLLTYAYGSYWLRRRARLAPDSQKTDSLPPLSIQIHNLRTYFGYGLCFFTFLSVDRVIAWSVAQPEPPPYVIWFRTPYELGIDWALLSLLLTLAVLQHTVQALSAWLFPKDQSLTLPIGVATRVVKWFHLRQLFLVLAVGGTSILGTYYGVAALERSAFLPNDVVLLGSPVTRTVFWGAALGYLFLAVGLHNLLFPMMLSSPRPALQSFLYALGANVLIGLLLSRSLHYEYAVVGLLAGSLVLAVVSFVQTRRFLDSFAYHYYAAY